MKQTIDRGIACGFFPSVSVENRQKKGFEYIFTAALQFEPDVKRDLFERARLIVASIRHGEYHAERTKIKYPLSILNSMRNNTLRPHSYADVQYAILKAHNIINIEPVDLYGDIGYKVIWIESPKIT